MEVPIVTGKEKRNQKEERKKLLVRVLAGVLCVGMVAMTLAQYLLY